MEVSKLADMKNDWVTETQVPDPSPLPNVPGPQVLVRPVQPNEKVGSILLPDSFKNDMAYLTNIGRVLKLGETAYVDPNAVPGGPMFPHGLRFKKPWCRPGDYVVWKKFSGAKFLVKGVSLVLLNDDEVLMSFERPEDFNIMFNMTKLST